MTPAAERAQGLLGVVLAGGAGRRLGGGKAQVQLGGRPLAAWVADALAAVAGEVVITAKPASALPELPGVAIWREPAEPVHPLAGIAWALSHAGGRDVIACPVDLPFCAQAVRALAERAAGPGGPAGGVRAVVAERQPLLGVYRASFTGGLREAVDAGRSARATIHGTGVVHLVVGDPGRELFNVNTPEDLARAEAMLAGG